MLRCGMQVIHSATPFLLYRIGKSHAAAFIMYIEWDFPLHFFNTLYRYWIDRSVECFLFKISLKGSIHKRFCAESKYEEIVWVVCCCKELGVTKVPFSVIRNKNIVLYANVFRGDNFIVLYYKMYCFFCNILI